MDISTTFIANLEPTKAVEPRKRAFDHPAVTTQALACVNPASCNAGLDAACAAGLAAARVVVALVGVQFVRPLARSSAPLANRRDGIQHRFEHFGVVQIGGGMRYGERDTLTVDHKMALRTRFAAIRG